MELQKYENLYSRWLYQTNGKAYGNGFLEVQVHKYPFHSGLRIRVTDGYRFITDVHCRSVCEAVREFKRFVRLYF